MSTYGKTQSALDLSGMLREYNELTWRRASVQGQLNDLTSERDALEERIVDAMSEAGIAGMKIDDRNFFLARTRYASLKPGLDITAYVRRLVESDLGDLLTIKVGTAKAILSEAEDNGNEAPKILEEICDYYTKLGLRSRATS